MYPYILGKPVGEMRFEGDQQNTVWTKPPCSMIHMLKISAGGGGGGSYGGYSGGAGQGGATGAIISALYPAIFVPDILYITVRSGQAGGAGGTTGADGGDGLPPASSHILNYHTFSSQAQMCGRRLSTGSGADGGINGGDGALVGGLESHGTGFLDSWAIFNVCSAGNSGKSSAANSVTSPLMGGCKGAGFSARGSYDKSFMASVGQEAQSGGFFHQGLMLSFGGDGAVDTASAPDNYGSPGYGAGGGGGSSSEPAATVGVDGGRGGPGLVVISWW